MNIRLLKKREMVKFHNWLRMTGYGPHAIDPVFTSVKKIEKIFAHQNEIEKRNDFCVKRGIGIFSYDRAGKAYDLMNYIKKRYERRKHGHK